MLAFFIFILYIIIDFTYGSVTLNIKYCCEKCPLGIAKSERLLAENNSAIDAAIDFSFFIDECLKTCMYKNKEIENETYYR